jgi:hypothetical protein
VVFIGRCSPGGFNKVRRCRVRFVERTAEVCLACSPETLR